MILLLGIGLYLLGIIISFLILMALTQINIGNNILASTFWPLLWLLYFAYKK